METAEQTLDKAFNLGIYLWDLLLEYGPRVILAIVTLVIGLWIIGILTRGFNRFMDKREFDPSLKPFLKSLFNATLKILLALSILGMVGIEVTSFIAILGAAGLAIGLALQGTLQNFAGGVVILILKPYEVGHYITGGGHSGTVQGIMIFNTVLKTPDNVTIIVPNSALASSSITNYSKEEKRRVDLTFGIGYDDDLKLAKNTLKEIYENDERVLKDPELFIAISALADSSVNIVVRAWVNAPDYWAVYFDMLETVKLKFDEKGITIPYPQREITMKNPNN